jgi:hypothetical protein
VSTTVVGSLPATVAGVLDALRAAGVQAATDMADLDPPGVLVTVSTIGMRFGRCHSATFVCWLLAPGLDRTTSYNHLAGLLDAFNGALGAPTGGLLPAYRLEFTRRLETP